MCALTVDLHLRQCRVNDTIIRLTPLEFELISLLMMYAGASVRRGDIISKVWGIEYETGTNFLDVHIHALRRKLKQAGAAPCIYTVRGVGYGLQLHGPGLGPINSRPNQF